MRNKLVAALSAMMLISACSSGSGSGEAGEGVTPVETIALDHMSDNDLQRSASAGSKQMQSGLRNTQNFMTRSDVVADMGGNDTAMLMSADPWSDAGVDGLIDLSLGLQGDANVTRNGNSLFVDPDDAALCQHQLLASDATVQEQQFCEQMVSDLSVRIDGQTENSGDIHYLYQDQALLAIKYAPGSASYKIHLDGLYLVVQKANSIDPMVFDDVPEAMSGIIELGMTFNIDDAAQESGSMALSVIAPITVSDSETGFNLNVAASDVLRFAHNDADGTASIEVDAGATALTFFDGNQFDFVSPGSTVRVDLLDNGDRISVSRLGFRDGAVTISIDSVEMMRMTLNTFGFDIGTAGAIKLTGALNFNVMFSLVESVFGGQAADDVLNLNLAASAPIGAKFAPQAEGVVKLEDAGPFNLDLSFNSNQFSDQQNLIINEGECFAESVDGNALFSQRVCP